MQPRGNNNILVGSFILLAVGSIELKANSNAARDSYQISRTEVETELVRTLRSQGFTTSIRPSKIATRSYIYAKRSTCWLIVRDASKSEGAAILFAEDAKSTGPVRYLYKGHGYATFPSIAIRLGRTQTEMVALASLGARAHIPVALASSRSCGGADFGLRDVRVGAS